MTAWVGDNWGQLWEEHGVLRDKEEVKEEDGLVTKKATKPGQSTADGEQVNLTFIENASTRAWTPQLNLVCDPGFALGTSLHFSGLHAFICEMVIVISISQSNYVKNRTCGCLVPHLACRKWSGNFGSVIQSVRSKHIQELETNRKPWLCKQHCWQDPPLLS